VTGDVLTRCLARVSRTDLSIGPKIRYKSVSIVRSWGKFGRPVAREPVLDAGRAIGASIRLIGYSYSSGANSVVGIVAVVSAGGARAIETAGDGDAHAAFDLVAL